MSELVVVGGGIGGLAAALSVSRRGHRAVVLEQAPEFAEIGAGIQIAPNGIAALDRLGVGDAVRADARRMDELRVMDALTGEHVVSLPLTEAYQRRFGHPYVVVHRAELHRMLLDACLASDAVELRSSSVVSGYQQDGSSAEVVLASGERVRGDAVIGADGIHSAIRRQMIGDGAPRVSGITVYRSVIPMERVPEDLRFMTSVTWWAGPGCHFVHYPIAGGKYLNLAPSKETGVIEAFAGVPVSRELVLGELAVLGGTAQRLLELGDNWRSWVLVDRDPVEVWTDDRVVLLGDAAHPSLHYVAQGACMALEDAVLLGDLLDCGSDELAERFRRYNAERRDRTAAIQLAARESTKLWHPAGEAARRRNEALSAMTPEDLFRHVAWMHEPRYAIPAPTTATAREQQPLVA